MPTKTKQFILNCVRWGYRKHHVQMFWNEVLSSPFPSFGETESYLRTTDVTKALFDITLEQALCHRREQLFVKAR